MGTMSRCHDCHLETMLYSTPASTKHSHSVAVCRECFKKRRGKFPEKIKAGDGVNYGAKP